MSGMERASQTRASAHLRAASLGCDGERAQILHMNAGTRRDALRGEATKSCSRMLLAERCDLRRTPRWHPVTDNS